MRRICFYISADIDDGVIELESKRRGRDFQTTLNELTADVECRLSDSIRFRDGVTRVYSQLFDGPPVRQVI